VRFKAGSATMRALSLSAADVPRRAQALSSALGIALTDGAAIDSRTQVMHSRAMGSAALAAALARHGDVEAVYENKRRHAFAAPNDPAYHAGQTSITPSAGQWYLRASSPTAFASINAETAWAVTFGSSNVVVAVLDTGVRFDHPDLAGKLLPGYDFISDTATSNDGDGRDANASDPGDYDSSNPNSTSSWHGTQTAGLVGAATNNGIGMASIGRDVMVLPVRVLGVNGGADGDILAGMRWAAGLTVPGVPNNPPANWAKVINMSLGAPDVCGPYQAVIDELNAIGVVVVVSAGNDGLAVNAPANCRGAIAVGGVRHTGSKVGYSSLGPEVAITAPAGNCVNLTGPCQLPLLTTINLGMTVPGANGYSDSLNYSIGTSFSSPLVAGTVGLMISANPALTVAQVREALTVTARPFPVTGGDPGVVACHAPTATAQDSECYCTTSTCGAGLLDAGGAVLAAVGQQALISVSATTGTAGTPITFGSEATQLLPGRAISITNWVLTDNGGVPSSFVVSADGRSATLTPSSAGRYDVALTITDSTGAQMTAQSFVDVQGAPASGGGGDGGGGALGAPWLLLLLLGTVAAVRTRRT
jgi:serine protease